jgi:hypothetical protein
MQTLLKKGYGFWLTSTGYPIGGCFHRATDNTPVEITGESIYLKSQGHLLPFKALEGSIAGYAQSFCFGEGE